MSDRIAKLLPDTHLLAILAQTRSFTQAAGRLGISKASVSMRVRDLERAMGVALVRRTTRSVSLTEAGARAYEAGLMALRPRMEGLREAFTDAEFEAALPFLRALRVWMDENR